MRGDRSERVFAHSQGGLLIMAGMRMGGPGGNFAND